MERRKLKIALVSQEYPPETARGGIGSQTYMKAKGLSALGHQVFVISRSDTDRYEKIDGDICVIRIPGMEDYMYEMTDIVEWITHSVVVAAEIDALNKRVGLDIIDFPEWAAEGYVYLLNRTKWYDVPSVIQLHGPLAMFGYAMGWPEITTDFFRTGTQMEATCVRLADAVYSSSACSTEWINKYYDPQKSDIPTIHLGVNTETFKPQPVAKNERLTIIFTGKIVKNKGVEELVEAAANLVEDFPGIQLRLVGRGQEKYIAHLKGIASGLGASELLDLPGFVDKESLALELSKAHIFCAPSYYEGGPGFVYLEAMACGLPVIGCSGSGVDEIINSGENGLLVPPKDTKKLEEALRKLLIDGELLNRMAVNAREYILREADSRICLSRLEEYYYSVIDTKSVQPLALQNG
ncbi:glycosyltransferase family 4 protein [Segetibacter aerophilus]|uniref:Glycosyl transferase n=1 Tax=Segetibacter aerophilus TaxID=670293 RepID=A0A512BIH9_9BACT|nr:glycosyltransferase family 4 protein [Segetibacter aerophilus]GEO11774.1 glycosyl transferase [Segetibacter aerophilus]